MRKLRYIVCLLAIGCSLVTVRAQVDREFWLAIPYLVNAHDQSQADGQGQLCITTLDATANVTITQPALTNTADARYLAPRNLQIPANSSVDVPVAKGWLNRAAQSGTSDYGLHVESDADIMVYYAQVNQNSEIYTYKGRNALGTSFVVPMQRQHSNAHSASSSIEIVASEPNTQVTITTPVLTQTNQTATTWTVTLQQGQVYTIYAASSSVQNHLGGTVITSNKPVAVNSTDDSVASTGQDLMGEQLVPEDLAGSAYIALKNNSTDERLYLYTFPGKPINYTLNGGPAQILAGGSNTMIQLTADVNYLEADAPFVCYQMTGDGGELGGTVLPRLDCTGSQQVAIRKRFPSQKVGLLVKTAYTADFTVNGTPYNFAFLPVPSAPEWSYAVVQGAGLFDASGISVIRNSASIFHCSILDYGGGTCSYGYFSGYNQIGMSPTSDKEVYVVGEPMHLTIGADSVLFDNVVWTEPDGTTHNGYTLDIASTCSCQGGWYTVTGESKEGCLMAEDTCRILVHVVKTTARDTTVCMSEQYPADTYTLYDSLHLGQNILRDTVVSPAQAPVTQMTTVYQERVQVRAGQEYQFSMNYSAATTSRNMTVNVLVDDVPIGTLTQRITSTPKTMSATYRAAANGKVTLRVEAGQSATATNVTLANVKLRPMVTVQDTLRIHVKDCSEHLPPCPGLRIETMTIKNYCDTLLPYIWTTNSGKIFTINSPGVYRDTVPTYGRYEDGPCDSIYYVLVLDTVHCAPEPPIVTPPDSLPCPQTQYDTLRVEQYCDTLLPYAWRGRDYYEPGVYDDTIYAVGVYDESPCDSIIYTLVLDTIHCIAPEPPIVPEPVDTCVELIRQRWDDVLFVVNAEHNGGYEFTSFAWFCNGRAIENRESYLYLKEPLREEDVYEVEVVTTTGETMRSCVYHAEAYEGRKNVRVRKVIEDGRLVIYVGEKRYNAMGQITDNR